MKYVLTMMVLALFAGQVALADNEGDASMEQSTTSSENPITGTVTTKHKMSKKHKDRAGVMHSKKHKRTVKQKTDGSTTTSSETEESHE
jgi:hypothetical protein